MRLVSCILCFIFSFKISHADIYDSLQRAGAKKAKIERGVRFVDGIEFNKISRGTLLKILATFEENINSRIKGQMLKPVFSAQFANNKIGRRKVLVICHVPLFIGWLYTGLAYTPKDLIIGRTITGLGSGMILSAPRVYATEICLPNMRGLIGAFPNIANALGVLVQAELGSFLDWYIICYICATYSATLMIANTFLPESPYYIILKDSAESARSALKRFRSRNYDIDNELNELQNFKEANHIRKLGIREQLKLILTRSACVPFAIVNTYIFFMQFSGVTILMLWTIEVIQDSKSSVDPYLVHVILSVTRVCSAIMAAFLFYKLGRRPLALASSIGVATTAISVGMFIRLAKEPSIFPLICYIGYMIFATVGYYVLPMVIMYELYPLQVRGLLGGISIAFFFMLVFSTNLVYPFVKMSMGHPNMMILFGIFSVLCTFFLYFCLPETKYLTLTEIEEYFNARRPALTSRRTTIDASQSFMRPLQIAKSIENTVKSRMSHGNIKSNTEMISTRKDDNTKDGKDEKIKKRKDDEAGPSFRQ